MNTHPLVSQRCLHTPLAWRADGPISVAQYCADVQAVAAWLASLGPWVVNLCEDRYNFAVLLGACALSERVSLQPSSQSSQTLEQLASEYTGAVAVGDAPLQLSPSLPLLHLPTLKDLPGRRSDASSPEIPEIPSERIVAILFTSGSTGKPQAHAKTWGKLVANGAAEAQALGLDKNPHVLIGTVPAQHSYGFESTFLLALHGGCSFWSGKPFYAQDMVHALQAVPQPRLVVTTPYHLSHIVAAALTLPAVQGWLSATAPLDITLAQHVETVTGAPVFEIYGSTESSQLATRRTSEGAAWTLMAGVQLEQEGSTSFASGRHVEGRVPLGDILQLHGNGRFTLEGRHADMLNLAGKRSSLAYLNHQLCSIEGVQDGAFFLPNEDAVGRVGRLAAFVVAPELTRMQLLEALRLRIDPVFMPRPLVWVEQLQRNATGKIERLVLEQLYVQQLGKHHEH